MNINETTNDHLLPYCVLVRPTQHDKLHMYTFPDPTCSSQMATDFALWFHPRVTLPTLIITSTFFQALGRDCLVHMYQIKQQSYINCMLHLLDYAYCLLILHVIKKGWKQVKKLLKKERNVGMLLTGKKSTEQGVCRDV